jgi:putative ABC transport system permease protein
MRLRQWLVDFRGDVRFAFRQMRRTPSFAVVAVMTLALGIGANSAMFALVDRVLLRPLPFATADRLVMVWERRAAFERGFVNPVEWLDWSQRTRTFDAMAAIIGSNSTISDAAGTSEQVSSQVVSRQYFDVLGATPLAGRTFVAADDRPDTNVVVLSEGLWRSRFGGDPALVGRPVTIDNRAFTVVGIMPTSFQTTVALGNGAGVSRLWTLFASSQDRSPSRRYPHFIQVLGRLRPGVTLEAARADLESVANRISQESPATNRGHGVTVEPFRDALAGRDLRLTSLAFVGVVGCVLLMCCTNVANLLLARMARRAGELAVRSALGAGRGRIIRQVVTESLVLATIGGALGAVFATVILRAASLVMPTGLLPATMVPTMDVRMLVFCAICTTAVALLFSVGPAWQASRPTIAQTMAIDGRTTTPRASRLRGVLTAGELAAAVLLLCVAGLLLRTLIAVGGVDAGYRAHALLTAMVTPPAASRSSQDELVRYYEAVEREVSGLPGVRRVAFGSALPLDGSWYSQAFEVVGDPPRAEADREAASYQIVSAPYFHTLGIATVAGRGFDDRDTAAGNQVCIVSEAFARRYLGNRSPLGLRLAVGAMVIPSRTVVREIVGVVADVKARPDAQAPVPSIYVPLAQNAWWQATLVVEPSGTSPESIASATQAAVTRVDRGRPASQVRTLEDIEREATSMQRFRAVLSAAFAVLALLLAVVGVFGILNHQVEQRRREFGVRMALGATKANVARLVIGGVMRPIVVGAATGLAAAMLLSRTLTVFLFGVQALDPITFIAVPLALGVAAAVAAAAPTWRAVRIEPTVAFRTE